MAQRLVIDDLTVRLPPGADRALALQNISLSVGSNEIVCVVGESGSGKSMTASAVMRLLPTGTSVASGKVELDGEDLLSLPAPAMRRIRGARIGMIFQEPMTALNPLQRIGTQIAEMFRLHKDFSAAEIGSRTLRLLEEVQIPRPAEAARAYPHELSGGQRQRAMIAMALALEPGVLIADEPTTALDVTTQAQILALIRELQQRTGTGVLFITHDFGVVAEIAHRVVVMQAGEIVEQGGVRGVLDSPRHPYTKALIAAVPTLAPPAAAKPVDAPPILQVKDLSKTYRTGGFLGAAKRITHAVKDVDIALPRGTTLGIVGESGSGKSTLARCIVRLIEPDAGTVVLQDMDYTALSRRELRKRSRTIQMVFQDPYASLNPRRKAGDLVAQGLVVHGMGRADARARARELFGLVGLDPKSMGRYPHEFSGGQRQRIGLARALALEPAVLVADEPVSALDVSVQAQVLDLLASLREQLGLSLVFITHDLRVTAQICDQVAVMKDGEIVEHGPTAEVFTNPRHPYTRLLLDSVPGRRWTGPAASPQPGALPRLAMAASRPPHTGGVP